MSTLDRLRGIVQGRSPVPVVAPELGGTEVPPLQAAVRRGGSLDPPAYARAAIILGGAVVERSEGAVIVVDREYRSGSMHGRLSIGDVASVITEGTDALKVMAAAWPSAQGIVNVETGLQTRLLFLDL